MLRRASHAGPPSGRCMKWLLALTVLATTQRAAAAMLTRGPYLQLRTTHSVTVIGDMDAPARCGLALHSPDGSTTVLGGGTAAVCEIRVESLSPSRSSGPTTRGCPSTSWWWGIPGAGARIRTPCAT